VSCLVHSKVRRIGLANIAKDALKFNFLKCGNIKKKSVQNRNVRQLSPTIPVVAEHNTRTSISIGKNSGWENGNISS